MAIEVFELADVAAILGIEKSRVKYWTIGRPFSVQASVRASFGKGSRNLFSRNDIYCFALVKRLSDVGAPAKAIQDMLEKLAADVAEDAVWQEQRWLFLRRTNRDVSFTLNFDPEPFGYINVPIEPGDCLLLYTDGVTEALDSAGDEFGVERTIESVRASARDGAQAVVNRVIEDVRDFSGTTPQNDDITLIAIRKT